MKLLTQSTQISYASLRQRLTTVPLLNFRIIILIQVLEKIVLVVKTSVTNDIEITEVNSQLELKLVMKKYLGSYLLMVLKKMRTLGKKRNFLMT